MFDVVGVISLLCVCVVVVVEFSVFVVLFRVVFVCCVVCEYVVVCDYECYAFVFLCL